MTRLIYADALREDWLQNGENEYVYDANAFLESIDDAPTVEAIPKGAYEQVRWERDMAIQQLADMGVQLGEKVDVQAVRHGKWITKDVGFLQKSLICSACGGWEHNLKCEHEDLNYCPNCGAKMED